MSVTIELSSCVKSKSQKSECTKCLDVCPDEAIYLTGWLIEVDSSAKCSNCMGCVSVCPTEAFGFCADGCFDYERLVLSSFEGREMAVDERLFELAA